MDRFLNPDKVLNELELSSDMIAADFGCGSGGFTLALAKVLKDGLVHGLDVQESPLSYLKGCCIRENINNVKLSRCNLEKEKGSRLSDSSIDFILIANSLFQTEDKNAIISEAKRVLKREGKLLIIDWLSDLVQNRISPEKVKKIAQELRLRLEKEFKPGNYHFGLIFEKA